MSAPFEPRCISRIACAVLFNLLIFCINCGLSAKGVVYLLYKAASISASTPIMILIISASVITASLPMSFSSNTSLISSTVEYTLSPHLEARSLDCDEVCNVYYCGLCRVRTCADRICRDSVCIEIIACSLFGGCPGRYLVPVSVKNIYSHRSGAYNTLIPVTCSDLTGCWIQWVLVPLVVGISAMSVG